MMHELAEAERRLAGELLLSREAWSNLVVLCDRFGSRFGGTEGEKGARDFILTKMREYGLDNPHAEEFQFTGWTRGVTTLEAVNPLAKEFPAIALPYTGTHDVQGEVIYVGYGTPTDFAALADQIPGKIVMCAAKSPSYYRRNIHRCEKIGRAIALGAIGFIWMRWDAGFLPETGAARWNREVEIPCIGVAREYGEELNRMARQGQLIVRIRTENEIQRVPSWNIVGDLRGATRPDEIILVGAHFDGHDVAPGAMDDGAGAVVVLEIARALAAHRRFLGRTLRFVTFPCEEIGLIGAYAYVDAHRAELDSHKFMLNLDGAGRGADYGGIQLQGDRTELVLPLRKVGKAMGGTFPVDNGLSLYSDHFPFMLAGVPAGSYARMDAPATGVRGWGHTAADTLDKVSPAELQSAALHIARMMLHLSRAEDWPARRQCQSEIEAILRRYELDEVLRLELRYPF